jgi:hypothetical protein
LLDLPADSRQWWNARAVALEARARGVAIGFTSHGGGPIDVAMSPDGTRFATVGPAGDVLVHDLERRTTVTIAGPTNGARWLGGDLVTFQGATLTVHAKPARTWQAPGNVTALSGAAGGGAIAWRVASRVFVLATGGTPVEVAANDVDGVDFAEDASLLAIRSKSALRIMRRDGMQWIAHQTLPATHTLAFSQDGSRIATLRAPADMLACAKPAAAVIEEWQRAANGLFERTRTWPTSCLSVPSYAGARLAVADPGRGGVRWVEDVFGTTHALDRISRGVSLGGRALAFFSAKPDRLVLVTSGTKLTLPVTGAVYAIASRGDRWLVAVTAAYVLAFDLREVWPEPVAISAHAIEALDENTLLIPTPKTTVVLDERTSTTRELPALGIARVRVNARVGRFSAVDRDGNVDVHAQTGAHARLAITGAVDAIPRGERAVVVAMEDGTLVEHDLTTKAQRTLAVLDEPPGGLFADGEHVVAVTRTAIVRSDGRREQRVGTSDVHAIELDSTGTVYLATGVEILRWAPDQPTPASFAKLASGASRLGPVNPSTLFAIGGDTAVHAIALRDGKTQVVLPASSIRPAVASDGSLAARIAPDGELELVELASGSTWSLPTGELGLGAVAISARAVYVNDANGFTRVFRFDLAPDVTTLRAWIEQRTNARTNAHGVLEWTLPTVLTPY